jgi:hypothetical protein
MTSPKNVDRDLEFERDYLQAKARGIDPRQVRASTARYNRESGLVEVELTNGIVLGFPSHLAEGLAGASEDDLSEVEITPLGTTLHWERLDVDLAVDGLMAGLLGSPRWMAELGRIGGKARTPAKAAAARINGQKGGRPRKGNAAQTRKASKRATSVKRSTAAKKTTGSGRKPTNRS